MSKYKLNKKELLEHWDTQIRFINKSIIDFDNGDELEAQRIATNIRVLFHNTKSSKSLYQQLQLPLTFYSSGGLYIPYNLATSWLLLSISLNSEGIIKYNALLDGPHRCFFMNFNDWWNEIIFDDHSNKLTRKDIVTLIANQDGGAHVDPKLNESYAKLTKMNSLGWTDLNGNPPINNPAYQSIRVIANEILISLNMFHKGLKIKQKQKGKQFEMRIVDNVGRRYKWSETEIQYPPEAYQIVSKDRAEQRTLYINEYMDGTKVEYIGQ